MREILEDEGIAVRVGAECIRFAPHADGVAVGISCEEGAPEVVGSHVLLAVGRRPNTDDLGLEVAGIEMDARGYIRVDDQLRTSVDGVWAMGDCNGARGLHPHGLQRLRDRGGEPAGRRGPQGDRPYRHLRPVHRSAAGPGGHGARPRRGRRGIESGSANGP
nr:FAD-dependent oxidoreductase [Brevundimonas denitrificans]